MTYILAWVALWIVCFIGTIIFLLCCDICYIESYETRVVSSHIPDYPTNLDVENNGQLKDEETGL